MMRGESQHRDRSDFGETETARVLSDAVENGVNANAVRELQHLFHGILLGVQNDVIRTVPLGKIRLYVRRRRTDHSGALRLGVLSGNETEPAGDGVNEDRVSLLDFVRFVHERQDGRGGRETGSAGSRVDTGIGRDGVDLVPREGDVLGVGA